MPKTPVPERYRDLLESTVLGHLATVDYSGKPQVNLVWFRTQTDYIPFSQESSASRYR